MTTAQALRPCPNCDQNEATLLDQYSPAPWQVVQCQQCSLTYLQNPVEYKALEEDFAWEKTYETKRAASKGSTPLSPYIRKMRGILGMYRDKSKAFRTWFNDGHVLDIGCGNGTRIPQPMTPYGIELSTQLHAQADAHMRAQGGYCVHGAGAQAIWEFPKDHFDGIIMHSYLEHETDVMSVLKGAHHALKPSGSVFIRVPNFGSLNRRIIAGKWCGFRYPDHVNYFTLKTLRDTVAKAGFTAELINKISLPIDDNISVLLRKKRSAP